MDTLVSPSRTVTIAGTDYLLDGSFATLRAVQETFRRDLVQILVGIMDMRTDEIATLIAIATGRKHDENVIGQAILDSTGAISQAYANLKTELVAWLNIAITPKQEREKKSAEMQAMIEKQKDRLLSLGATTNDSPSAPSDGSQANSGDQTPGS